MFRSVLAPLDGSPFSEQALPLAISIAERAGASLQLVAVAAHPWLSEASEKEGSEYWAIAWRAYFEPIVERIRGQSGVSVNFVVLAGEDVAARIAAHAESSRADLIVMTTHGRGALGRFWLGSVAFELLRISPAPLLFVRPEDGPVEPKKDSLPKHLLVPLDGSPLAEGIIEPAVALGSLMGADYELVRVISDIPRGTPELDAMSLSSLSPKLLGEIRVVQKRVQTEAENYLDGIAKGLRARGLQAQSRVIVANDPAAAILEAAEKGNALVAIETRGRRGLANLAIGSVARKVVCGAMNPVFVQSATSARHKQS